MRRILSISILFIASACQRENESSMSNIEPLTVAENGLSESDLYGRWICTQCPTSADTVGSISEFTQDRRWLTTLKGEEEPLREGSFFWHLLQDDGGEMVLVRESPFGKYDTGDPLVLHEYSIPLVVRIDGTRMTLCLLKRKSTDDPAEPTDSIAYEFQKIRNETDEGKYKAEIKKADDAVLSSTMSELQQFFEKISGEAGNDKNDGRYYRNDLNRELICEVIVDPKKSPYKEEKDVKAGIIHMLANNFVVGDLRKYGSLGIAFTLRGIAEDGSQVFYGSVRFAEVIPAYNGHN